MPGVPPRVPGVGGDGGGPRGCRLGRGPADAGATRRCKSLRLRRMNICEQRVEKIYWLTWEGVFSRFTPPGRGWFAAPEGAKGCVFPFRKGDCGRSFPILVIGMAVNRQVPMVRDIFLTRGSIYILFRGGGLMRAPVGLFTPRLCVHSHPLRVRRGFSFGWGVLFAPLL